MTESSHITVYDVPIEVDCGVWSGEHPDCDAVVEFQNRGLRMKIFAFANSQEGNADLRKLRDQSFKNRVILKGLSRYASAGGII